MDERAAISDCKRDLFRARYLRVLAECNAEDRARMAREKPVPLAGNPRLELAMLRPRLAAALERVSVLEAALEGVMKASSWTEARKIAWAAKGAA